MKMSDRLGHLVAVVRPHPGKANVAAPSRSRTANLKSALLPSSKAKQDAVSDNQSAAKTII